MFSARQNEYVFQALKTRKYYVKIANSLPERSQIMFSQRDKVAERERKTLSSLIWNWFAVIPSQFRNVCCTYFTFTYACIRTLTHTCTHTHTHTRTWTYSHTHTRTLCFVIARTLLHKTCAFEYIHYTYRYNKWCYVWNENMLCVLLWVPSTKYQVPSTEYRPTDRPKPLCTFMA